MAIARSFLDLAKEQPEYVANFLSTFYDTDYMIDQKSCFNILGILKEILLLFHT